MYPWRQARFHFIDIQPQTTSTEPLFVFQHGFQLLYGPSARSPNSPKHASAPQPTLPSEVLSDYKDAELAPDFLRKLYATLEGTRTGDAQNKLHGFLGYPDKIETSLRDVEKSLEWMLRHPEEKHWQEQWFMHGCYLAYILVKIRAPVWGLYFFCDKYPQALGDGTTAFTSATYAWALALNKDLQGDWVGLIEGPARKFRAFRFERLD